MFEQDYVMRLIREMVRAILKLLFRMDTDSPAIELPKDSEEKALLEAFLEENHFSRDEVRQGVENIACRYGLGSMADVFL